jgi:hypothetical protein
MCSVASLTIIRFFFPPFVETTVTSSSYHVGINNLKDRIQTAISAFDVAMQQRTWPELEYLLDIMCVTKGAHVKCLLFQNKL